MNLRPGLGIQSKGPLHSNGTEAYWYDYGISSIGVWLSWTIEAIDQASMGIFLALVNTRVYSACGINS